MSNWNSREKERIQTLLDPLKCKFVGFNIIGDQRTKISPCDLKENDLILGYDESYHLYFAWNAHVLRMIDRGGATQSVECKIKFQKIKSLIDESFYLHPIYQVNNGPYVSSFFKNELWDKMLIISESFIEEFCKNPFYYLIPYSDDEGYNPEVSFCMPEAKEPLFGEDAASNFLESEKLRIQYTCTKILRDSRFRKRVLDRCNHKCVVCETTIPCILQAAHIVAVKDDGSNDPKNGVCLCANHHLMFDRGLFNIVNKKINVLDEEIQSDVENGKDISKYLE